MVTPITIQTLDETEVLAEKMQPKWTDRTLSSSCAHGLVGVSALALLPPGAILVVIIQIDNISTPTISFD